MKSLVQMINNLIEYRVMRQFVSYFSVAVLWLEKWLLVVLCEMRFSI
jgi:hypothetical protein